MNTTFKICAAILLGSATSAFAQEACTNYTIKQGDSLSNVARAVYGVTDFQSIFDANRDVIGNDPSLVEVGMILQIPCADGSLPTKVIVDVNTAAPNETPKITEAKTSSGLKKIKLVTASGYQPYTDENLAGGGIYTQLIRAAGKTLEPNYEFEIVFINDWNSHLDVLLSTNSFDGSFPWIKPNCADYTGLTPELQYRCDDFDQSNSYYDIVKTFFVKASNPLSTTTSREDFLGKTICLPNRSTDAPLADFDLLPPNVTLIKSPSPDDCMRAVMNGDADATILGVSVGNASVAAIGIATTDIVSNPAFTSNTQLSVYTHGTNENKFEIVNALNQGLRNIQESGKWFQIVSEGLAVVKVAE